MKLSILRYAAQPEAPTLGLILIDDSFACYTLEDPTRREKVAGDTCIPEGVYQLKLRTAGGMHVRYTKRFPDIHKGMLHVTGISNFSWVYLHCGRTRKHTEGCPLVGDQISSNPPAADALLSKSVRAYERIYPVIAAAIEQGPVMLTVKMSDKE